MQIIIDQAISRIRAFDSNLAQETMQHLVKAALEAFHVVSEHKDRVLEEMSSQNFQQRNRPGKG